MPLKAMLNDEVKFAWMYTNEEWDNLMVEHKLGSLRIKMCCCDSLGHLRRSKRGVKHFYHASTRPANCTWEPETEEHLYLKSECARNAWLNGWDTDTEVRHNNWRADVYCKYGPQRVVFEVQRSKSITSEVLLRERRYDNDDILCYWLLPVNENKTVFQNIIMPYSSTRIRVARYYKSDEGYKFLYSKNKSLSFDEFIKQALNRRYVEYLIFRNNKYVEWLLSKTY